MSHEDKQSRISRLLSERAELEDYRSKLYQSLEKIDHDIKNLDRLIADEESHNIIVTSDKEFDDASADPRYHTGNPYKKTATKEEIPLTTPINKSHIKGLYKGENLKLIPSSISKNEAIQREKIKKSLESDKNRKFRTKDDTREATSNLINSLNNSRNQSELRKKRETEEKLRHNEEYRNAFDLVGPARSNYEETVVSNKSQVENYNPINDPAFDRYSMTYIAKRYMPKEELIDHIGTTQVFTVSEFFARCSDPQFDQNYPNFIISGVVVKKVAPSITQRGKKFRRIFISDFKTEIALMLFDNAFQKYWNVSAGSIVAILNPEILKPGNGFTYYSLRVTHDSNSILEYASLKNFGKCLSEKCDNGVDRSKTHYCPYHQGKRADRAASQRNEMGTNYKSFAPHDKKGNVQVMVVTEKELERSQLVHEYKNKSNAREYSSTSTQNIVKPNGFLTADFSNPETMEQMKTEEEKSRHHFSSSKASFAFMNPNAVNKTALLKQERDHKRDLEIKRRQIESNYRLKKESEKAKEAFELQEKKKQKLNQLKEDLSEVSKSNKSLKMDKSLLLKKKRKNQEISDNYKKYNFLKRKREVEGNFNNVEVHKYDTGSADDDDDDDMSDLEIEV